MWEKRTSMRERLRYVGWCWKGRRSLDGLVEPTDREGVGLFAVWTAKVRDMLVATVTRYSPAAWSVYD